MRKLVLSEFVTLDGVMEAPGGEPSLGDRAGWTMPYFTDEAGKFKFDELIASDALLLGRKTYEGFAAAWPSRQDEAGFAERMNSLPKYVVSTTLGKADWNNSTIIKGDVANAIRKLKEQPGQDILLGGSCQLAQSLMRDGLIDEYRLMVFPVVLGTGKRLFTDSDAMTALKLVDSSTTSTGVAILTYQPAAATA
jgi:dihydrofolate reductase